MTLSVGTFNLNNLFTRFNYETEVAELPGERRALALRGVALLRAGAGAGGAGGVGLGRSPLPAKQEKPLMS